MANITEITDFILKSNKWVGAFKESEYIFLPDFGLTKHYNGKTIFYKLSISSYNLGKIRYHIKTNGLNLNNHGLSFREYGNLHFSRWVVGTDPYLLLIKK